MEEKIDRLEKNMHDLIEIVGAIKDNMATKHELEEFKEETKKNFEMVAQKFEAIDTKIETMDAKIDGLQRAVDSSFERQGSLEARISKVETQLHI